jgi:hypothetical protein
MNISLVITGLATCASLFAAGVDWQWGDSDGCGEEDGVDVDLGLGPRPAHGSASRNHADQDASDDPCADDP